MTVDHQKALVRRVYTDLWSKGNLTVADELIAADYVNHQDFPGTAGGTRGLEALKRLVQTVHAAFSDFSTTIEDQVAEGDKVVTRWVTRGIHTGEWAGVAPTGRRIATTGISIDRVVGGKLVETWTNSDVWGVMEQLGVVSLPQPGR